MNAGETLWVMGRQERRRLRRARVQSARFQRRAMHAVPYARRVVILDGITAVER